ncbi:MAG: hypothetical protein F6K03_03745 [Kamptonema sp. SIO4C4]|nr:hypothetical protein [Kamptonema sp. SIO4C4]
MSCVFGGVNRQQIAGFEIGDCLRDALRSPTGRFAIALLTREYTPLVGENEH